MGLGVLGAALTSRVGDGGRAWASPARSAALRGAGKPGGGVFLRGINLVGSNRFIGARTWPTKQGLDYWLDLGMNCFRLNLMWENLQPALLGDLDERSIKGLTSTIEHLTARGAYPIVEMHGFGRLKTTRKDADPGAIIGESAVTAEMFADLWARLAGLYKDNDRVIFEPINEPHDQNTDVLVSTYNTVIAAVRARGARNLILLDGNTWSGANSWLKPWDGSIPNATAMLRISDAAGNYAFTPHEYLDGHGGTLETCIRGSTERGLPAVTEWARQHGFRLLLGEFGGGDNPICHEEIAEMITFVERNDDVWFGWTYFGAYAGQRSYNVPDNFFHGIDPIDYKKPSDDARTQILRRFIKRN